MATTVLTIGPAHTLVQNQTYAVPGGRSVLIHVQNNLASIEQSNDGNTWNAVTLDDDESFLCGGVFIRSTGVDTILTLKG